jgi:hypothetical protein
LTAGYYLQLEVVQLNGSIAIPKCNAELHIIPEMEVLIILSQENEVFSSLKEKCTLSTMSQKFPTISK